MAAYFETAFFFAQPAWHKAGTVLDHAPTSAEAFAASGLDWLVVKEPLFLADGTPVPNFFATVRSTDRRALGGVGRDYAAVQNSEAFDTLDDLLGGTVTYESAGSLRGGQTVWALAHTGDVDATASGGQTDTVRQYLLFTNSHDGMTKIRVLPTDVRVVCWNTLSLALRSGQRLKTTLAASHRANWRDRIAEAKDVLANVAAIRERWQADARKLVDASASKSLVDEVISFAADAVISRGLAMEIAAQPTAPAPGQSMLDMVLAGEDAADRLRREKAEAKKKGIVALMLANMDREAEFAGGANKWALYNAVSDFADHQMHTGRISPEGAFASANMPGGAGNALKQTVLERIIATIN